MKSRGVLFSAAISGLSLIIPAHIARAQDPSDEWKPLVDDTSRADLFRDYIEAMAPPQTEAEKSKDLRGPFRFPDNALMDRNVKRKDSIFGIDISHWSSIDSKCAKAYDPAKEIDFSTLGNQQIRFVYVKATQDVGYRDCRFLDYWHALGALHASNAPLRGAYHFLTETSSGADQARSYVKLRTQSGGFDKKELPSVLDLEWDKTSTIRDRWVSKKPDEIIASALQWLDFVEKASGKTPIVYTSNAWISERHIPADLIAKLHKYPLWIADYSKTGRAIEVPAAPKNYPWAIWQFTEGSKLTLGSSVAFDATIYKGKEDGFARLMQLN